MKILVINAGSSSLKYQLVDMDGEKIMAKGLVERIGIEGSNLAHKYGDGQKFELVTPLKDHPEAMNIVLDALVDALLTGPEAFKGQDPIDSYCGLWDTHM